MVSLSRRISMNTRQRRNTSRRWCIRDLAVERIPSSFLCWVRTVLRLRTRTLSWTGLWSDPVLPVFTTIPTSGIVYAGTWGSNSDVGRYNGTQNLFAQCGFHGNVHLKPGTQVTYVYDAQSNLGHGQIRASMAILL